MSSKKQTSKPADKTIGKSTVNIDMTDAKEQQPAAKSIKDMTPEELEVIWREKKAKQQKEFERKDAEYQKRKHDYVVSTGGEFLALNQSLKAFKASIFNEVIALHKEMYEIRGKEAPELKSYSIQSKDGKMKVTAESQDRQGFDETAEVAVSQIKEILTKHFKPKRTSTESQKRQMTMYKMLMGKLEKNSKGEFDPKEVYELRKHEKDVNLPAFSEALNTLFDSYKVTGTSKYVRVFVRQNPTDAWEEIPINFARL